RHQAGGGLCGGVHRAGGQDDGARGRDRVRVLGHRPGQEGGPGGRRRQGRPHPQRHRRTGPARRRHARRPGRLGGGEGAVSGLRVKPGTEWDALYRRCRDAAPEAFAADRARNRWGGSWRTDGEPRPAHSPVDGTEIAGPPLVGAAVAESAVRAAADEHRAWREVGLPERKARVRAAVQAWRQHRDTLALALGWEIGKPWRLACQDVDRAVSGVEWYLEEIDAMLEGRAPLDGPVSNIASWNYPMSVLAHAMCVQALAGNAAVAKTPTDGGLVCLTLAVALAVREGLPFTLVGGGGRELSPVLVGGPEVGGASFVGGRDTRGQVATDLADLGRRHILEQEGLNCWGVWEFSDWEALSGQIRKTFDYAKQRCTAYPRFVVQRNLFDRF